MSLQEKADLVRQISIADGWELTADEVDRHAGFLDATQAAMPAQQAALLRNHHADHQIVSALRDRSHPDHADCWKTVSRVALQGLQRLLATRQNNHAVDADDLAQVVLERVDRGLPGFRYESRLTTWVCKIALNVFRGHVRTHEALRRQGGSDPLDAHVNISDPQDRIHSYVALRELMAEIVATLQAGGDPRLITIFQLKVIEDKRLEDISARLRLSPARISALLMHARQLLRNNPRIREAARGLGISLDNGEGH